MASYTTLPIPFAGLGADLGIASYTTASIKFRGNITTFGSSFNSGLQRLKLVRLNPNIGIGAGGQGGVQANQFFTRNMNKDKDEIERSVNEVIDQVNLINMALARAANAEAAAQAAQVQAASIESGQNLKESYTAPLNVLTADNAGVVTIAAHSRVYGDGTSVDVAGGSISGQFGTVYISYDDPERQGGVVEFMARSTNPVQSGSTHVVGAVTVPDVGAPPTTGSGPTFPGFIPQQINVAIQ